MCLHDGIASQCVAARLKQMEKLSSTHKSNKKRLKAMVQQSLLNSRFINMNYNNLVIQLRKLCNHPYLVLEDAQSIPDDLYFRDLVCSSGKLVVLDRLLDELLVSQKNDNHKILIFSQMTTMLNILQGFLQIKGISCYRLDGSTDRQVREEIISNFFDSNSNRDDGVSKVPGDRETEKKDNIRVFLLSTRAGKTVLDEFCGYCYFLNNVFLHFHMNQEA